MSRHSQSHSTPNDPSLVASRAHTAWRALLSRWRIGRVRAVEVALIVAAVVAVATVAISLPGHWGLFDAQLLWVPVIAIAVLYGSPTGHVAALLTAFVYVGLVWFRADSSAPKLLPLHLIQPALFLLVGGLTGEVVSCRRGQLREAERRYGQVFDLWRTFYERHTVTLKAKAQLETRLIALCASMATLCDSAARVQALRNDHVWPSTAAALAALLDTKSVAIYDAAGAVLRLRAGLPPEVAGRPAELVMEAPPGAAARVFSLAAPVRDGETNNHTAALQHSPGSVTRPLLGSDGRLLGAVVIEDLPLAGLSQAATTCVEQILSCTSLALQNTCVHERNESGVGAQPGGTSITN